MRSLLIFISTAAISFAAGAQSLFAPGSLEITNLDKLNLNLEKFKGKSFAHPVKVAVLDNGFYGYEDEVGKGLPAETICYAESETAGEQCKDEFKREDIEDQKTGYKRPKPFHGVLMAEIVAQILKKAGDSNYTLSLFRTGGIDRLGRAVDQAIADRYDIIVYSDVWEFGGNGDGKGFVNAVVSKASSANIIWLNAAGNFGRTTKIAPVEAAGDWISFKDAKGKVSDGVKLRCTLDRACTLRLVLSWNDFKDDPNAGSDKSLSLHLYDDTDKQIDVSDKIQMLSPPDDKEHTKLPRQMIVHQLDPSAPKKAKIYTAKVKIVTKNFDAKTDQLRLTASGIGVEMLDPSPGESLLPPADNPGVIDIGASDDPQTAGSASLGLPKIYFKSELELKNGLKPFQSSTATAIAGAMTALYIGTGTEKSKTAVEKALAAISQKPMFPLAKNAKVPKIVKKETAKAAETPAKPEAKPVAAAPAKPAATPAPLKSAPLKPATKPSAPSSDLAQVPPPKATPRPTPPGLTRPGTRQPGGGYTTRSGAGGCLPLARLPYPNPAAEQILALGNAVVVEQAGWPVIAVNYDFAARSGIYLHPRDRIFVTPDGPLAFAPGQTLPADFYEVVPLTMPVCGY